MPEMKYVLLLAAILGCAAVFTLAGGTERLHLSLDSTNDTESELSSELTAELERGHFLDVETGVVPKRVFSPKMRMVFPVGLEGTGHHLLNPVLHSVCALDAVVCPDACGFPLALYDHLGNPATTADYATGLLLLRQEMETLAEIRDGLGDGMVAFATFANCHEGYMSYPMLSGPNKPLQHVDLKILAREAERMAIDLRFLYLGRSAKNILISDTEHRNIGGGFVREARVLINAASVISSSFAEVDPDFITCLSYDNITDPTQTSRIAEVVVPTPGLADRITHSIELLTEDQAGEANATDSVVVDEQRRIGWRLMSNRLQEKLDYIERNFC